MQIRLLNFFSCFTRLIERHHRRQRLWSGIHLFIKFISSLKVNQEYIESIDATYTVSYVTQAAQVPIGPWKHTHTQAFIVQLSGCSRVPLSLPPGRRVLMQFPQHPHTRLYILCAYYSLVPHTHTHRPFAFMLMRAASQLPFAHTSIYCCNQWCMYIILCCVCLWRNVYFMCRVSITQVPRLL